jgi:hypothetical protein
VLEGKNSDSHPLEPIVDIFILHIPSENHYRCVSRAVQCIDASGTDQNTRNPVDSSRVDEIHGAPFKVIFILHSSSTNHCTYVLGDDAIYRRVRDVLEGKNSDSHPLEPIVDIFILHIPSENHYRCVSRGRAMHRRVRDGPEHKKFTGKLFLLDSRIVNIFSSVKSPKLTTISFFFQISPLFSSDPVRPALCKVQKIAVPQT